MSFFFLYLSGKLTRSRSNAKLTARNNKTSNTVGFVMKLIGKIMHLTLGSLNKNLLRRVLSLDFTC